MQQLATRLRRRRRHGFTLIELFFTLVLISVLSTFAMNSMRDILPRFRTRQAAREFANAVQTARIQAIQNNKEARVRITDYDTTAERHYSANAGAWIVELGDKTIGSSSWTTVEFTKYDVSKGAEQYKKHVSLSYDSGDISGPSTCSCTDSIVFTPAGKLLNPTSDFESEGDIRLTFVNKAALADNVTDNFDVRVYRAGMARVDPSLADLYQAEEGGTATNSSY